VLLGAAKLEGLAPKLLAAQSAGEKYSSMKTDMKYGITDEDGNVTYPEYNALQMIAAPLIHGYAEGASDSVLGAILGRAGKVLKSAKARPDKLLDDLVKSNAASILKKMPAAYATVQAEEQSAEQFTNLIQNFNDKVVLGKDVGMLDNTGEVFKDTFLMASLFGVAPHIAGAALSTLLPKDNTVELISNSEKMQKLSQLINTPGLSEAEKNVYKTQIDKLSKKSGSIVGGMVSKLDDLSRGSYNSIVNMSGKLASLRNQAKEINESDSPTKAEALNTLRDEYTSIEKRLDSATSNLSRFEDITGKLSAEKKTLIYDEIVYSFLNQDGVDTRLLEQEIEKIGRASCRERVYA
jgi:hypothetical protein